MKRNGSRTSTAVVGSVPGVETKNSEAKNNGTSVAAAEPSAAELSAILSKLQRMRDGDFSVRLPGSWTGLSGKIADTFNDIVAANQQMAQELQRVGQVVGKQGKTRERTRFTQSRGAWGEMEVSVNTLVDDLTPPYHRSHARHRRRRTRQPDSHRPSRC